MEKQIFKVGDKVFDIRFGWGTVIDNNRCLLYPIGVQFDKDDSQEVIVYTNNGISNISEEFSLLSFTEYILQGFTQERPVNYKSCIGNYGRFWDNEENTFVVGKLYNYLPHLIRAFELKSKDSQITCYENFEPLTEEQLKILGLKNDY